MNTTEINTKQFVFDNKQYTVVSNNTIVLKDEKAVKKRNFPFPITLVMYPLINSECVMVVNETIVDDSWVMNIFRDNDTALTFMRRYLLWHGVKY